MSHYLFRRVRHVLVLALLAALVLSGCSPANSNSSQESGAEKLATFKGGDVTRAEFNQQLQSVAQQSGGQAQLPSEGDPQYKQLVAQIMPQLVQTEVAKAYAQEHGITVSDKDVNQEIAKLKKQLGQQARSQGQNVSDEKAYKQALKQAGFTEQQLRSNIQDQLPIQKVQKKVAGDAKPSDKEVRKYYDENKASFAKPEQRCASHILFSPDAKKKAEEVKKKLENGGDFAALAKKYSEDPGSADKGGDLGCQPKTDPQTGQPTYAPAFNDALFADSAKEGDIIGPVKTQFGYHLIKLRKIEKKSTPSFDKVQSQIRDQLTQQAQSTEFQKWLDKEVKSRNVQYLQGYNPNKVSPSQGGTTGGG